MASLTHTSTISRKAIRYGIYAIIFLIIARFTVRSGIAIFRFFFPPSPPKPTIDFGTLPSIPFPEKEVPDNLNFTLETPDGKLPNLPSQTEIFFMPPIASNIRALEVAKNKANSLGFNPNGKPVVENVKNVYLFQKEGSPATLTMNIISGIFSISYDINANPKVLTGIPPAPEVAISKARSYLGNSGYLTEDLKDAPTTFEFLRVEGGKFTPTISLSEANLIKVNLFRINLGHDNEIPSVTPSMPESNVWFIYSGFGDSEIVASEYHHFPLDLEKSSTYPLITADLAWEELKNGNAYIANLGENETKQITVRRVYLAYYDAGVYTEFYQPVVVFENPETQFYAYVPAITGEYYGGKAK
jgi:hypothetical protein